MALVLITITAEYDPPWPGAPVPTGQVRFQLTEDIRDPATNLIVSTVPILVPLDNLGKLTQPFQLYATDSAGVVPQTAKYEVTEELVGAHGQKFRISVPAASPGATLDLADAPRS